jgi:diguanylate cyclase (GGDEF)-like protein
MTGKSVNSTDRIIRATFTASLFDNPNSLIVGAGIQGLAFLLAYADTNSVLYLLLLVSTVLCAAWRFSVAKRFEREQPDLTNPKVADAWNQHQMNALCLAGSNIGMFGFLGVYYASTNFTQLAAPVIVIAAASTILGKYYGSKRHTILSLCCIALPFLAGLVLRGDASHTLLAVLSIPFIAMISGLADGLRATLFESTRGRLMLAEVADRFNTALNNMPHGLIMVDDAGRIEVINRQFYRAFDLDKSKKLDGRALNSIFAFARRGGLFVSRAQADVAATRAHQLLTLDQGGTMVLDLSDGRHMQVTAKKRSKGGGVLIIEDITARLAAERKIERMARFDELTGLQNRAWFKENVENILAENAASGTLCAMFAIDVDDFKSINDTYGHGTGDELLQGIAKNLAAIDWPNIVLCRHGGDEFAVFAAGLESNQTAANLAEQIVDALSVRYEMSACRYSAEVSLGYAVAKPDAADFQTMVIQADLALYARKSDKSQPFRAYEEELDRKQRERLQLKSDLGEAIRNGALTLVYQPQIDVTENRLASCEALVRWTHPQLGPISPAIFVPIAEEMGIVTELTRFVVAEAAKACASWPAPIGVSVNLSAIDFQQPDLADYILGCVTSAELDPRRFEVEITESVAIKGQAKVARTLSELRSAGIKVALDDFGVGYSGLSHLNTLPLDSLKIDRSFILEINDNARSLKLLSSVITLASALDLEVTIEGVEDVATLDLVTGAGKVHKVQGYVFGAHFSRHQIEELASRHYAHGKKEPAPAQLAPATKAA